MFLKFLNLYQDHANRLHINSSAGCTWLSIIQDLKNFYLGLIRKSLLIPRGSNALPTELTYMLHKKMIKILPATYVSLVSVSIRLAVAQTTHEMICDHVEINYVLQQGKKFHIHYLLYYKIQVTTLNARKERLNCGKREGEWNGKRGTEGEG